MSRLTIRRREILRAAGLPDQVPSPQEAPPSPWLLGLMLIGALLCSVPLLGLLALLLQKEMLSWLGLGMIATFWGGALLVLRWNRHVFMQCCALVAILAASVWLSVLLLERLDGPVSRGNPWAVIGAVQLVLVALSAACLKPRWMKSLLGLGFVAWCLTAWIGFWISRYDTIDWLIWTGVLALTAVWAALLLTERHWMSRPWAADLDAFAGGAGLGLMLAVLGNVLSGTALWPESMTWLAWLKQGAPGVLLSLAASAVLWRHWSKAEAQTLPGVAPLQPGWQLWLLVIGGLAAVGSVVMPWLAVLAWIVVPALVSGRLALPALGIVVFLYSVSRFYTMLEGSLVWKGLGLMVAGLVLCLILAAGVRFNPWRRGAEPTEEPQTGGLVSWRSLGTLGVLLGGLACLVLVNLDVMRKEEVMRNGEVVLVPLAPVDPRSLMQGDYMALRFDLPSTLLEQLDQLSDRAVRRQAHVVVELGEGGEAKVLRLAGDGETLAPTERRMPIKRLKGTWVLVTDAYFFPEGDGPRFEQARYGVFRVMPGGGALLAGLADEQGQPIAVSARGVE